MRGQRLIAEFNKNSMEIIKVNLQEWRGKRYVDIRIWLLQDPTDKATEIATKKGITLNIELLPELIEALVKAQKVLGED